MVSHGVTDKVKIEEMLNTIKQLERRISTGFAEQEGVEEGGSGQGAAGSGGVES